MKNFLVSTFFVLLCTSLWAQEKDFFKNSIDVAGGIASAPTRMHEHDGVTAWGKGGAGSLRYTRYFNGNWGAFLQYELEGSSLDKKSYYSELDKLDGGKYTYNAFKTLSTCPGLVHEGFFLGGVYRFDVERWNLRPYAGVGYASAYLRVNRYYRTDNDGKREAVIVAPSKDDDAYSIMRPVLAGKLGIQFKYKLRKHFNIGVDLDLTAYASGNLYTTKVYKTEKIDPTVGGVILDILTLNLTEDYKRTELLSTKYSSKILPPAASIKFTLGWDF